MILLIFLIIIIKFMNNKILVIGAGPIIVGQACEFDYSGTQACKTLKKENFEIILLNSNPATIMTDYEIADKIYIDEINLKNLIKIIIKEKPNFILPTMGGQTALNCILELMSSEYYFPEKNILGINKKTLINAESRCSFYKLIKKNGLKCPDSVIIKNNFNLKNIQGFIFLPFRALNSGQKRFLDFFIFLILSQGSFVS
uniref:Carbamoyl-phosphate synthase large chain n=1 Tax=Cacopsylla melanoneura TaxID=428564 RepID=A0A8D8QKU1_9HEMI